LKSNKVSAVVIEPTNWQTGLTASDSFISELSKLSKEFGAALIVDETNTGCGASGKGFWQYTGPADYVTFGSRTQATGYFSAEGDVHMHLGGSALEVE
jgi:4-aminobutyrate aminotransferase/(S)-3-amino-2-methylpropionate transaminase